jgi:cholesterol transport system auxiliary component
MSLRPAIAAAVVLLAGGCIGGLPGSGTPPRLYDLSPKSTFDAGLPNVSWQLIVQEPTAASGLDTTRVAVRQSPLSIEYYKGVAWTDRAPRLVQTLIIESLENSGKIVSVGREAVGLRADYILKTELRDFEADATKGNNPVVAARINAKLVRMPDRTIVANETFEAKVPAQGSGIDPVMAAFDEALGRVMKRLVEWTLKTGAAMPPPAGAPKT